MERASLIGWRGLFLGTAALALPVLVLLARRRPLLEGQRNSERQTRGAVARGHLALLRDGRARRTYAYVLVNAIVHGGIYTWLGLYFTERFELSAAAIGVALLGYGAAVDGADQAAPAGAFQ